MSILNKYNQGNTFNFQTPTDFEFKTLKELYKENGTKEENTLPLKSLFINTKSKFGDSPVAVTNKELVNLPGHLLENVRGMISDDEVVELVNKDHVGIEIYEYESAKWGTNYSVRFVEQLPF